jgi:hypothetical protein
MPAAYSTPLDSTAQFHLSHAFGDGTHSRSLARVLCGKLGKSRRIRALRNVRRWPRNAVPPSCQYGMALDRMAISPEPSDVHNDFHRTCFMPLLGRFKKSSGTRTITRQARMAPCLSASVCVQALPASLPQPAPSPDAGAIFRQAMQPRFVPQTFRAPGSWRQANVAQRRLQCRDSPGRLIACHVSAVVSCHLTASGSGWECKASRYRPGVWRFTCGRRETGHLLSLVRAPARRTACCLYTRSRVRCRFGRRRSVCVKAFVHSPSVACLHPSSFVDDLSLVAVESRAGGS